MSQTSNKSVSANDQIQNMRRQIQASDLEKEQLRSEIWKLKEALTQTDALRQRVITAESKVSNLQQMNLSLSQQVDNLTSQNSKLLSEISSMRGQQYLNLQNDAIKNKLATAQAKMTMNAQESQVYSSEIKQLRNQIITMQEKHRQEIEMRDNLISKLRQNTHSSLQTVSASTTNASETTTKTAIPASSSDQQLLLQQYSKKKNELILLKHQIETMEEETNEKIKKTKKKLEETRRKFHLLKKKYVEQKDEYSSLQASYQAAVMKLESMSMEFQRQHTVVERQSGDEFAQLAMEKQRLHDQLIQAEERLAQEKDCSQDMRMRAEKAEGELTQLRCFLKILANNERNLKRLGLDSENIIDQIETLGIKLDRLGKMESTPSKRKPMTKKRVGPKKKAQRIPPWRQFQNY